jgi:hypothetical protein
MEIPCDVKDAGHEAIQAYKRALAAGSSPRFAEMVALGAPPATKGTDRNFMQGRMNNQQLDEMPLHSARWLSREAKQAGINISGKYYCGGIADKRGWKDPEAWVSSRDEILRVAQKRRMAVSGAVEYDPGPQTPKRKLINEKIVNEEIARAKRHNPKAKAGELREQILEKHTYRAKGRT